MMTTPAWQPVPSLQATAYVIRRCDQNGIPLNNTKLQKLLYCCYGTVLAKWDLPLMDERPQAWAHGPVFPASLRALQFFGLDGFRARNAPDHTPDMEALPAEVLTWLDTVLAHFGRYTPLQLCRWTLLRGSPWSRASRHGDELYGDIRDVDTRRYFRERVLT